MKNVRPLTKVVSLAVFSLLLCAANLIRTDSPPTAPLQIALAGGSVVVGPEDPAQSWEELYAHPLVRPLIVEISDFCEANSGASIDVEALQSYLQDLHASVTSAGSEGPFYYYMVGPDGDLIKVCYNTKHILVEDDPSLGAIHVQVDEALAL